MSMSSQRWTTLPAATVAALALLISASATAQQEQEPGMQQQEPGAQQDPGMQQQDPGAQQEPGAQQDPGMQQQDPGMEQPQPDQATFSGEQIDRFVDAYLDIIDIQESYTADIEETDGAEEARELQEEANDEMVAAIEDNGLSVPEYSEIANAMDMNPELRDEVSAKINEREED
ncbi:MAG: DUF4168 domain-containing protein [Halorhodospira sp.]